MIDSGVIEDSQEGHMDNRNQSRDYDSEIAAIVAIAERNSGQVSPILAVIPDCQQVTPIIKWVTRTDENESHADA